MALKQNLRPRQKLRTAVGLRQSLKYLSLNQVELESHIKELLAENPFLEEEQKRTKDEDYVGKADFIEEALQSGMSLQEHLNRQIHEISAPKQIKEFLYLLVSSLDERGFTRIHHAELFRYSRLSSKYREQAIEYARKLDPIGVGAESMWQSLAWQAKEKFPEEPLLEDIIYLLAKRENTDMAKKDLLVEEIASLFWLNKEKAQDLLEKISMLDPFPAREYIHEKSNYVYPEIVYKEENGSIEIFIQQDILPGLRVNRDLFEKTPKNQNSKLWNDKYKEAVEFLNSLQFRKQSIQKVAHILLKKQADFFQKGPNYVRPLNLKEVAEEIGVHVSTVSRIISHKYFESKWGIFPLKFLFPYGIETEEGNSIPIEELKLRIIRVISEEPREKPYSDQKIADLLNKEGLKIKRRTITKYRMQLNIPSTRERKISASRH
ncbi:MAG: RNA polymerase sigma-54 factor [Candidatus Hydrogenedentota bacterium]|nr:MAG: RNA polymerase sigma-54 factor [Candidatus Hydrogenedentota bacterium]